MKVRAPDWRVRSALVLPPGVRRRPVPAYVASAAVQPQPDRRTLPLSTKYQVLRAWMLKHCLALLFACGVGKGATRTSRTVGFKCRELPGASHLMHQKNALAYNAAIHPSWHRTARRPEFARLMAKVERVLIVGGGLAGLALTIALRQRGLSAAIVERASDRTTPGAGLYLIGSATRALQALGIADDASTRRLRHPHATLVQPSRHAPRRDRRRSILGAMRPMFRDRAQRSAQAAHATRRQARTFDSA